MLKFDYEKIHGVSIKKVLGVNPITMNDGTFSCDLIAIHAGQHVIVLSVNIDTDEIVVELDEGNLTLKHNPYDTDFREKLVDIEPVLLLVGKTVGWAWEATNQQGYNDCLLLAFGDEVPNALQPAIAFVGEASSISISEITPLRPRPDTIPRG